MSVRERLEEAKRLLIEAYTGSTAHIGHSLAIERITEALALLDELESDAFQLAYDSAALVGENDKLQAALDEMEAEREAFDKMVLHSDVKWDMWRLAFGAAMNTPGSFRSFLHNVRKGTALDWWETDYRRGLDDGSIVPRAILGKTEPTEGT